MILAVLSQEKIVQELIPYISSILNNEEDEVLLAIAEEMSSFKNYLDPKSLPQIFPIFQILFGCDETVVRECAVEKMKTIVEDMDEDSVQKHIVPLIITISNLDQFQMKVSSLCLIRMCYAKAGKDKDKLRSLYFRLCDDDTPIIKRTAAKEFGPLCLTIEKNYVISDMLQYYKKFMGESDIIRTTILPSLVQLAKLSQNADMQKEILKFIVAASEDKSWRVRNQLSILYPEIIVYFGSQINELIPTLASLINDSETEVKISALKSLKQIIERISSDKIQQCIIPAMKNIGNENSKDVKANIGECLGPISVIIGYNSFNTNLRVLMDTLMKDDNADVRLGIAKSMYQIFVSSDGTLLSSINAIIGTMQKDSQYRIRECIYEILGKLGAHFGLNVFKNSIESLFFTYITDTVSCVRQSGENSLRLLIQSFGNSWIVSTLIPKLQTMMQQGKTSYLNRLSIVHSLCICGEYLDPKSINDALIPLLLKCLKDKISNVRFVTIRNIQKILKNFDNSGKDKIVSAIKSLIMDEDVDVKFYASKFMESIK